LIIVRGTDSDISFVQNTLDALRQKAQLDGRHKPSAAATVNPATGLPLAPPGGSVPAPDAKTR
jgi:hypothetical protein